MTMGYPKPSKQQRNTQYLQSQSFQITGSPYQEEQIEQKKLFLIICEGKNTEPLYFKSFPVPTKTILVEGGCNSKTALVEHAITRKKDYPEREVWCVFDYDVKPDESATQSEDFNNSITMAQANGMHVAWSNDAFELWFLLHYQQVDTAFTRNEIYPKLKEIWELDSFHNEAKTESFCRENYERHGGTESKMQQLAIRRARSLHEKYKSRTDYATHCPCTTVYLLVDELNKNLKD